jgi:hypothetical protein
MFRFSSETLPLSEACMQILCPSLNSPVVDIDELPVAPARAAIVVYAEEYGDLVLAIGLRSLDSGRVALFRYRDALNSAAQVPVAVESARSFAEGMGFLFDEDLIELDPAMGRHRALLHWNELMGEVAEETEASVPDEVDVSAAPATNAELLLDDLVDLAREDEDEFVLEEDSGAAEEFTLTDEVETGSPGLEEGELLEAATAEILEPVAVAPKPSLTKFRRPAQAGGEAAGAPSALGRIPIVRMRQEKDSSRPSVRARLLGSF